jgi:hypothetical protein
MQPYGECVKFGLHILKGDFNILRMNSFEELKTAKNIVFAAF